MIAIMFAQNHVSQFFVVGTVVDDQWNTCGGLPD
jgi:hypothetical protein